MVNSIDRKAVTELMKGYYFYIPSYQRGYRWTSIQVFEDVARHFAVVTISDSGKGLNQEEIDEINQPFDYDWEYWKNENRGIGLRYVKAMLESFYDGQTSLFVNSKKGFGTKITILLPVRKPEEKKEKDKEVTLEENKVGQTDERIDCR